MIEATAAHLLPRDSRRELSRALALTVLSIVCMLVPGLDDAAAGEAGAT
jgi:hypothetical protein